MTATDWLLPSPVERLTLRGQNFYVKRDDLIHPAFSGNKFRKLQALIARPASSCRLLVSYGGFQSNAMDALAHLAAMKGWRFLYLVKAIPKRLRERPEGNFARALALGMETVELGYDGFYEAVTSYRKRLGPEALFVPQGGADPVAEEGVARLAGEIEAWRTASGLKTLNVVTPAGTGTTALYLRRHLPAAVRVHTVAVVGDEATLRAQWRSLAKDHEAFPNVLEEAKWPFAKPRMEYLQIWEELQEAGILFDLIYAPRTWLALLRHRHKLSGPILYVHSGGTGGNATQLARYRRLCGKDRYTL